MFTQARLIAFAAIGAVMAILVLFAYGQYHENLAKTAQIAQQNQALAVQKETISNLTQQFNQYVAAIKLESRKDRDSEAQHVARTKKHPAAKVGTKDLELDSLSAGLEEQSR